MHLVRGGLVANAAGAWTGFLPCLKRCYVSAPCLVVCSIDGGDADNGRHRLLLGAAAGRRPSYVGGVTRHGSCVRQPYSIALPVGQLLAPITPPDLVLGNIWALLLGLPILSVADGENRHSDMVVGGC